MTGKQRAALRKASMEIDTVFQVGKGGVEPSVVKATADCLAARELIKLRVLENSPLGTRDVAEQMAERTGAQVVLVRGRTFVLFLPKKKGSAFEEIGRL
ncbi:YhbY family RNA-binding protein [Ruminococcaceae bacterium OttesenSCG-928-I18]|nr:YhbY family RNA-binding protein [Ruminococcaceae bacterium OttesenSCG-928-I18]